MEKRYAAGFTLNSFYTLSKTLSDADNDSDLVSGATYYNRRLEKARTNYDVRHRFVNVLTYQLPFGEGKRWMNSGGIANAMIGGWELTWIQTLQSGPPFSVTYTNSPNRYLPGASRPNIVTSMEAAQVPDWEVGPSRFPTQFQNPLLELFFICLPCRFHPGHVGPEHV